MLSWLKSLFNNLPNTAVQEEEWITISPADVQIAVIRKYRKQGLVFNRTTQEYFKEATARVQRVYGQWLAHNAPVNTTSPTELYEVSALAEYILSHPGLSMSAPPQDLPPCFWREDIILRNASLSEVTWPAYESAWSHARTHQQPSEVGRLLSELNFPNMCQEKAARLWASIFTETRLHLAVPALLIMLKKMGDASRHAIPVIQDKALLRPLVQAQAPHSVLEAMQNASSPMCERAMLLLCDKLSLEQQKQVLDVHPDDYAYVWSDITHDPLTNYKHPAILRVWHWMIRTQHPVALLWLPHLDALRCLSLVESLDGPQYYVRSLFAAAHEFAYTAVVRESCCQEVAAKFVSVEDARYLLYNRRVAESVQDTLIERAIMHP